MNSDSGSRRLELPVNIAASMASSTRSARAGRQKAVDQGFAIDSFPELSAEQAEFVFWYHCTTTLAPETIAELFNRHYRKQWVRMDRWRVQEVIEALDKRWKRNRSTTGEGRLGDFLLTKPNDLGWCACDHQLDCVTTKRRTRSAGESYAPVAFSIWAPTFKELLACPRGRNGAKGHVNLDGTGPSADFVDSWARRLWRCFQLTWNRLILAAAPLLRSVLKMTISIGVWFLLLDFFYTPITDLSQIGGGYNIFCHTTYGFVATLGFVHTCLQNLFRVPECLAVTYRAYQGSGVWGLLLPRAEINRPQMKWIAPFLAMVVAAWSVLWVCSMFGLIDHWQMAAHPKEMEEMRGMDNFWANIQRRQLSLSSVPALLRLFRFGSASSNTT